jgi:hypothetical protein
LAVEEEHLMLLWRLQPTFKGFYVPCSIPAPQHPDTVKGGGPSEDHLQYTQTPTIPYFQLDVQHYCKEPGLSGHFHLLYGCLVVGKQPDLYFKQSLGDSR